MNNQDSHCRCGIDGEQVTGRDLGEAIGRVIALFVVAALVPTVVLLLRKGRGSAVDLTAVGMIVLAAFWHFN